MNIQDPLNTLYFDNDISFQNLENIVKTLDHVSVKQISRQKLNDMGGKILQQTGEDKLGVTHTLYIPDNLLFGELLYYIDLLNQNFNIKNHKKYKNILISTKIFIGTVIRNLGREEGEKYLLELKEQYNISDTFINELDGCSLLSVSTKEQIIKILDQGNISGEGKAQNTHILFGNFRKLFKQFFKQKKYRKLGTQKDIENSQKQVSEILSEEFKLIFFRKGINLIQQGLHTITQTEQQGFIDNCEKNGFIKTLSDNGQISYKKGNEKIYIHVDTQNLDKKEQLLREKLNINDWKYKLTLARINRDNEYINQLEIEASNHLLKTLYEFPYIKSSLNYGFQANKIVEYKEIYCVGYSLIGHAFLEELGIKHNGLDLLNHSSLEIIIGGESYLFDATFLKTIEKIEYGNKVGVFREYRLSGLNHQDKSVSGDPEKILLSHIYNNKGCSLDNLGNYNEAIECYNAAIKLNPDFALAYNNKGYSLHKLGNYNEAIECYNAAIKLKPDYALAYNNKSMTLNQLGRQRLMVLNNHICYELEGGQTHAFPEISDFIKNKDFEGLRLFALILERTIKE